MSRHTRGAWLAVTTTLLWAGTGIGISYLLEHYPLAPLTLVFWRDLLVAAVLVGGLALFAPRRLVLHWRDVPFLAAYGAIALALLNASWSYSIKLNGAAVGTVLAYSSPAFAVVLGWRWLKEPLTRWKLAAVALSAAGCLLVVNAFEASVWRLSPVGVAVGLATGLIFAGYTLAGRWSASHFASPWTVTAYSFSFAALALAFTQTRQTAFSLGSRWDGWAALAALALGPSVLAFGLYTVSLRHLPAGTASLITTLEPAFAAVLAVALLRERLALGQWLGIALIVAAPFLSELRAPAASRAAPTAT